jgi:co-chaperonin GroES (HSP10)
MERRRTFNNMVIIKLDKSNDSIKLGNNFTLYVDTSFDMEKHATVTGEVYGLPSHLQWTGKANIGMPWQTNMEIKYGDKVIFYYLSVINALKKEEMRYIFEGEDRYIFIKYENIYAVYGDGFVKPVNGYCLIEPCANPVIEEQRARMKAIGMQLIADDKPSKTHVVFGKVKYISEPNRQYVDEGMTDEGCDIKPGDTVVLRRTHDIPLQYDLHAKIDNGAKYWRVQRRNILAKI